MDSAKLLRVLFAISTAIIAVVVILWVQAKFDGADRRAALGIVQEYHSKAGSSIPEILDRKHPGKAPVWSVQTQSACFHYERVRAAIGDEVYDFMVDIDGPSIHPGNPAGEEVMSELDEPPPPSSAAPPASGAPPASAAPPAPTTSASAGVH